MTDRLRLDLLALCALRSDDGGIDWSLIAREAARPDGVAGLLDGRIVERSSTAARARPVLRNALRSIDSARDRVESELQLAASVGARLITVLDDSYPANLRLITNLPPFLFVLGDGVSEDDLRSVAVVGTRTPSSEGQRRAHRMASQLAEHGVAVVSGLARGIDTAAHRASLDSGGRTIAVIGTGITTTYPKENADLAAEIAKSGAVVSQFWPSTGPARWTFPRRNVVMSGIAQGTVVVEASNTSGAKMQARFALEHGKQLFLLRSLVTDQPWAQKYVQQRGATEVSEVEQVLARLAPPRRIVDATTQRQLAFDLA